jgi:hypothetical protein
MSTVTGYVTQNSNSFNCPLVPNGSCNDWALNSQQGYSSENCCQVDTSLCPVLGGSGVASVSFTDVGNCVNNITCEVSCQYQLSDVDNFDAVIDFIDNFGFNDDYNEILMPTFCSQSVTTCPADPITGGSQGSCSRFSSIGQDGALCQAWARNPNNNNVADSSKTTYCENNPTGSECACINRSSNPVYTALKNEPGNEFNDGCWWKPCSNIENFLVRNAFACARCKAAYLPNYK